MALGWHFFIITSDDYSCNERKEAVDRQDVEWTENGFLWHDIKKARYRNNELIKLMAGVTRLELAASGLTGRELLFTVFYLVLLKSLDI